MNSILVTGGAGFIGSHTALLLKESGFNPIVLDSFEKSSPNAIHVLKREGIEIIQGNVNNHILISEIHKKYSLSGVIHFAAFIEAGESVIDPLRFYENNLSNFISLLWSLQTLKIENIIFSSTAAIYGYYNTRIQEHLPKNPLNPYGASKLFCETILENSCKAYGLKSIALRYFNASGAHPQATLGEDHNPETHLIPLAINAARNNHTFNVFGSNYPTPDGTCIRDYIHVQDLAEAHIEALKYLINQPKGFWDNFNIGSGVGFSVMEVLKAIESKSNSPINVDFCDPRPGDPAALVANIEKIYQCMNWKPGYSNIDRIINDAWNYFTLKAKNE